MTVKDVFTGALAVMGIEESDGADYKRTTVPIVNLLLWDLFDVNNSIRQSYGQVPMERAPVIADLEDEIPYEEGLVANTMPFGLATYLYAEENQSLASFFNAKYEEGKRRALRCIATVIEDVYKSDGM